MPKDRRSDPLLITLAGDDVSPETVPASELAEFLVQFETAVIQTVLAKNEVSIEQADQELFVSLVEITGGSEALTFALSGDTMLGASLISNALFLNDYSSLPLKAHEALHNISAQATRNQWSVEFVGDKKRDIKNAVISVDNPVPRPKVVKVQGDTTIYGRLTRVGGVRPRAMLKMTNNQYIYIELSKSMAVELASEERLYEEVGLEGTATWRVDTMEMLDFKARRITNYRASQEGSRRII